VKNTQWKRQKNVFFINICHQNKRFKIKIEIEKTNLIKAIIFFFSKRCRWLIIFTWHCALDMRKCSIWKGHQQIPRENPRELLLVIQGDGSSVHAWTCFHKMLRFTLKWKAVQSYSNNDVNLLRYFQWERFLVGEDMVMQDLRMSAIQFWHEITEVCPSLKTNYQEFFPLRGTCWLSFH